MDLGEGEETLKNILVFILHNTISQKHVQMSLKSLFAPQDEKNPMSWDEVIVHNTHDSIHDGVVIAELNKYVERWCTLCQTRKGPYKSLHQDLIDICTHLRDEHVGPYRVFFLKADYCVSSNFSRHMRESLKDTSDVMHLALPIYNAKEWVTDDDILKKLVQPEFIPISHDTCYRGGTHPFLPREESLSSVGKGDLDPSVKFISHAMIDDYNLHVFGSEAIKLAWEAIPNLTPQIEKPGTSQGWIDNRNFFNVFKERGEYRTDLTSFGVHVFHAANRLYDMRKMSGGQRY